MKDEWVRWEWVDNEELEKQREGSDCSEVTLAFGGLSTRNCWRKWVTFAVVSNILHYVHHQIAFTL